MKNYLLKLKEILTKNKSTENSNTNNMFNDIANELGLEFTLHSLEKITVVDGVNCFEINNNNMIFLYPINDGMPTCPFAFFKDNKIIINNEKNYLEITNLDDILLQIVRIFSKSLDKKIVIDPYYFMLKLEDDIKENYNGKVTLVITDKAIRNHKLNTLNFNEANKYFINHFLDHFIGWNFGVSVNRSDILRKELNALNNKVINMGIREYAGTGFEVYGTDSEAVNGLQHYYLQKNKLNNKVK